MAPKMMLQVPAAICACVVLGLFSVPETEAAADVTAPAGRVTGLELDVLGTTVHAFLGIPFAEPPLGDRRFRRAEPKEPWDGIYNATRKPNACSQDDAVTDDESDIWAITTGISEDCLYLNLWQPSPAPTGAAVMVWIYGGGFQIGSSSLGAYDGRYLAATEGVIVVGVNYRLSTLGFLYAGTDGAPGNVGLTDQVLALQWVHDNIAAFGGDPDQVTIFGDSAGGTSVGYHLISPGSWSLFSRGIQHSGATLSDWAEDSTAASYEKTVHLAEEFGCPTDQGADGMLACLRDKDAQELVTSWYADFYPVLDGDVLPQLPSVAYQQGAFKKADVLLGSDENEGYMFFVDGSPGFSVDTESLITKEQFLQGIPFNLPLNEFATDAAAFQYTDWENLDKATMYRDALDNLYTDYYYFCPDVNAARAHVRGGAAAYVFQFTHYPSNSPYPAWMGAIHGDEVVFVYGLPLDPARGFTEEEGQLARRLMRYWANFAKTGNPNNHNGSEWSTFNETYEGYMVLNTAGPRMEITSAATCAFWDNYVKPLMNKTDALLSQAGTPAPCDTTSGAPGYHRPGKLLHAAFYTLAVLQLVNMYC